MYNEDNTNSTNRQPTKHHPLYKTSGTGKNEASLVCKACLRRKEKYPNTQVSYMLKSNQAAVEEYQRLSRYLTPHEVKCKNTECSSHSLSEHKLKKRGLTTAGKQRYECLICNKSFVDSDGSRNS